MNFCGSYRPQDVTFLLKRLEPLPFVDVAQKEQLIQSGARHYSEMLSPEALPSPRYLELFQSACVANRQQMARDCLLLAALIAERRSGAKFGRASTYAQRFAAKEACAKALGTGMRRGVFWRDMGVVNRPSGEPTMALTGGAAARLAALTPAGHEAIVHLTLTDDHPWAQAFVVLEARPLAPPNESDS